MTAIRFDGRTALVTGAGGSLGRAFAIDLAVRGAVVFVNDLGCDGRGEGADPASADAVVEEIRAMGGEAHADYRSVVDGEAIVGRILDERGRLDVIVHSAGILRDSSFHKMTREDWDRILDVHLLGVSAINKAAWPGMRDRSYGRIVMITSAAGLFGNFGQVNYAAAKMALVGMGQSLALEGEKRNIKVNLAAPVAGSRLVRSVLSQELCDALKPEYVAPLVTLLSSEAFPVNGAVFEVGAGVVSRVQWLRSKGVAFRIPESFDAERVMEAWDAINDMRDATITTSFGQSTQRTLGNLTRSE